MDLELDGGLLSFIEGEDGGGCDELYAVRYRDAEVKYLLYAIIVGVSVGGDRGDEEKAESGLHHLSIRSVVPGVFRDGFGDVVVEGVGEVGVLVVGR